MTTLTHEMPLRTTLLVAALTAVCTTFGAAHAENTTPLVNGSSAIAHGSASAAISVKERVRTQLRAAIAELIANGAFGNQSPREISFDVDAPGQHVTDLGVLVDSARDTSGGLHVLGVTPGSAAEKMDLRAGDVLMAVNGTALNGSGANAAAILRHSVDNLPNDGMLAFEIDRGGRSQTVSGALTSIYVPAMRLHVGDAVQLASNGSDAVANATEAASGCGRISEFDVAPRQQQLHAAKIIAIDGQAPGPTGTQSFRVPVGPHVVTVFNLIDHKYLPFNDIQRNSGLTASHYKKLTVDVRPDTTTLVAARLNADKRNDWLHDAYWDPVAWKQTAERCR
ncbi:MAG: PDZ domain-containing protein [Dokdonella sp.]